MIKDIEKMLKYQKVDMQLYILDKKLKNADETKNWVEATNRKKSVRDEFVNVDRDIDSEMVSVNKANDDFANLLVEANDLENSISENASIDQLDYFLKKIDDLLKKVKDIENIGNDSKRNLEKLNETAESSLKQIVKCNQIIAKFKPAVEKLRADMMVEAKKIKAELDNVVKTEGIDTNSKIFTSYKTISKRKMPVFVELDDRNCSGCGVDAPIDVVNKVNNNGFAECPNCGRILYQK